MNETVKELILLERQTSYSYLCWMVTHAKVKTKAGKGDTEWLVSMLGKASPIRWHPSLDPKVMHTHGRKGETARRAVWLDQSDQGARGGGERAREGQFMEGSVSNDKDRGSYSECDRKLSKKFPGRWWHDLILVVKGWLLKRGYREQDKKQGEQLETTELSHVRDSSGCWQRWC